MTTGDSGPAGGRGRYGPALGVAVGWYATVAAAFAVGIAGVPTRAAADCPAGDCVPPGGLYLLAALAVPALFGLFVVTAVVMVPLARLLRSAVLAGSVGALVAPLVAGGLLLAYRGMA